MKPTTTDHCPPPKPGEPVYQELVYELLLGGPDGREVRSGGDGQETEPGKSGGAEPLTLCEGDEKKEPRQKIQGKEDPPEK